MHKLRCFLRINPLVSPRHNQFQALEAAKRPAVKSALCPFVTAVDIAQLPAIKPPFQPSYQPSTQPFSRPSVQHSSLPSGQPSCQPSSRPSTQPSSQPSSHPSVVRSSQPSVHRTIVKWTLITTVCASLQSAIHGFFRTAQLSASWRAACAVLEQGWQPLVLGADIKSLASCLSTKLTSFYSAHLSSFYSTKLTSSTLPTSPPSTPPS